METLKINILNPKALTLLRDLADMELISIQNASPNAFENLLEHLRSQSDSAPSLEEITKEVEDERANRYLNLNSSN